MTVLLLLAAALLQVAYGHGYDYGYGQSLLGHGYGYGHGYAYGGLHTHVLAHPLPVAHSVFPELPKHDEDEDDSVLLTCKTEGANSLSVNVKNRKYSHLLSHLGYEKTPGLEATVDLQLDTDNQQVAIVFTKLSREDCLMQGMKYLVNPKGFSYYMHHVFGYHHHQHTHVIPGVIHEGSFGTDKQHVFVDRLAGFTSLAELSGRGVQVCPEADLKKDSDGKYVCAADSIIATGLVCCALEYANEERSLP